MRDARHRQIHADFGALAVEVHFQPFDDLGIYALRNADDVFSRPDFFIFHDFREFGSRRFALRAEFGGAVPFVNITADLANKFFHNVLLLDSL